MKPIAVQRSWEKNSRVGRSFWLLSRTGQRFGSSRKGRVKRTEPQRPLSFLGSFSPASKTAPGKWSSPNPVRSRLRCCEGSVVRSAAPGRLRRIPRGTTAEFVNPLVKGKTRPDDLAADLQGHAELRAKDIRGQSARVHGVFRSTQHLIQPGRAHR